MTLYQTISLATAVFFSWDLLPVAHAVVNDKPWSITLWNRLFFSASALNLVMSFAGWPGVRP